MKKRAAGHAHQLFAEVMHRLGAQGNLHDTIPGILESTCRYFHFGCGFIYETSYAKVFELKEIYSYYENNNLPLSIDIFSIFSLEQIEALIKMGITFIKSGEQNSELATRLTDLFVSQLLVLVPITNNEGELIGLLGMSDRRGDIALSPEDFEVALSVLRTVANQVKLRTYQDWLENTRNALESILDNIAVDIYVTDFSTYEIIYANSSMARSYNGLENMMGKKCWEVHDNVQTNPCLHCVRNKLLDENGNPTKSLSWDFLRTQDNTWQRVTSACFRWVDGRMANVLSSVNITENKQNEELIRRMAEYDDLTGLPNRRKLVQDMEILLIEDESCDGYVLFFDLDNFKSVNDDFGHQAGDELLRQAGLTLQNALLTKDHCYRHSGDEFVLVYKNISLKQLFEIIEFVLGRFFEPWRVYGSLVKCTCSMGIAHFPTDGRQAFDLLHAADLAMYASKKQGRSKVHFYEQGQLVAVADWRLDEA